jgi:TnpA family transposase
VSKANNLLFTNKFTDEQLAHDWTLSKKDNSFIQRYRKPFRLWLGIQLCAMRLYGRFLEDCTDLSPRIINYLASQLALEPTLNITAPAREATYIEHRQAILNYLGFSRLSLVDRENLEVLLIEQAQQYMDLAEFTASVERKLLNDKKILPPKQTLQRIIKSAYATAFQENYEKISEQLTGVLKQQLDKTLEIETGASTSFFNQLKDYPPSASIGTLKLYLRRYQQLRSIEIWHIDLLSFPPAFIQHIYGLAKHYTTWELARFATAKRYSLLLIFLYESQKVLLDHLVALHDQYMTEVLRETKNLYEKRHRAYRKRHKKALDSIVIPVDYLLEQSSNKAIYLKEIYQLIPEKELRAKREDIALYKHLEEHGFADILCSKYRSLRKYFAEFIKLPFEAQPGSHGLMEAISIIRKLDNSELKSLPRKLPHDFIDPQLRNCLKNRKERNLWELGVALAIKDKLRSGDLFLSDSKRHTSFWNLIYQESLWQRDRLALYEDLNVIQEPQAAAEAIIKQFNESVLLAKQLLPLDNFAKIENGCLVLKRDDKLERSAIVDRLQAAISSALPKIRIEDLLIEVDKEIGFTRCFKSLTTNKPIADHHYKTLMAAIIALATNLGIVAMANSTYDVTVDNLRDMIQNCIRQDTLKAANSIIVDKHTALPLSLSHGQGALSSSDAQRFGITTSSLLASYYPRYFGYYEKAIGIYTHVSDQYSVFNTKAVSCSPREALYVLDGLLENDTILPIREHTTDTAGYTEHIFALCFLLGFDFMPRIKDLKDQQLYRIDKNLNIGALASVLNKSSDIDIIIEQWDQMLRVAASLKKRLTPAHVIIERLINGSPSDRLARAFTQLGRLIKTQYILRYITEPELRRKVQIQLNKGEYRHKLSRWIFFANQGEFHTGDYEEIMNKASCLSLVSNAILYWNTRKIDLILSQLQRKDSEITNDVIARISLLPFKHVIPNGAYFIGRN